MAATLHPNAGPSLYPRALMNDLDFKDNRYPAPLFNTDRSPWDVEPRRNYGPSNTAWPSEQQYLQPQARAPRLSADLQSLKSHTSQSQEPQRSSLSYALPPGAIRRVVERYSLDGNDQRDHSRSSTETRPTALNSPNANTSQPEARPVSPMLSTSPRHPNFPSAAVVSNPVITNGVSSSPIMPLSASPSYNPPIASKHRAFPQQPTYVTPPTTPAPINTVFSPKQRAQEEVCVECAMRDQDMADVDVTSPGVWERDSDATYEDLKRRELDDEANGVLATEDSTRPRTKGGLLTEHNLKLWLSVVRRSSTA
jgi:hypothetical protein